MVSTSKDADTDLRQIPAAVGKKRSSIDSPEHNPKKTKAEVFDRYTPSFQKNNQISSDGNFNCRLFGDEDTDLRQLALGTDRPSPVGQRLSPMAPNQLSPMRKETAPSTIEATSPEITIINDRPPTPPPPIISSSRDSPTKIENSRRNFDVSRAKLANATNKNKSCECTIS